MRVSTVFRGNRVILSATVSANYGMSGSLLTELIQFCNSGLSGAGKKTKMRVDGFSPAPTNTTRATGTSHDHRGAMMVSHFANTRSQHRHG